MCKICACFEEYKELERDLAEATKAASDKPGDQTAYLEYQQARRYLDEFHHKIVSRVMTFEREG